MVNLVKDKIDEAVVHFADAMMNDELHVHFFPNEKTRKRKLKYLFKYKLQTQIHDCIATSPLLEGLAIWEQPHDHRDTISLKDILGFQLLFTCGIKSFLKMVKYYVWAEDIRNNLITEPHWYLDTVIVQPIFQGKGYASQLIKPILEKASQKNEKVYLETQNEKNVPIYERYGFELISTQHVKGTEFKHFSMIKK